MAGEAFDRDFDEVRVAEVFGAVSVGKLHRFCHEVDGFRGVGAARAQVVAFEDVEDLDDVDATGGGRRHGDDLVAAVVAAYWLAFDGAVVAQVFSGHRATCVFDGGDDFFGGFALVEAVAALFGDAAQGGGEFGLFQGFAGLQRRAVCVEEDFGGAWPFAHSLGKPLQRVGETVADGKAFFGEFDGGRKDLFARHRAVFFEGKQQAIDGTGDANGEAVVARALFVGVAFFVEIHIAEGGFRRFFAVINGDGFVFLGVVDEHEAATADVAGARQGNGEGKADGHARINGVTALLQDVAANGGGKRFL